MAVTTTTTTTTTTRTTTTEPTDSECDNAMSQTLNYKILPDSVIFEHFIVVGEPLVKTEPKHHASSSLLFHYPAHKEVPSQVPQFCFPNGISSSTMTPSQLQTFDKEFCPSKQAFIFVLTGEDKTFYGICISREELADIPTSFFGSFSQNPTSSSKITRRCYCFLTFFPFFPLFFDLLDHILELDHIRCHSQKYLALTSIFPQSSWTPRPSIPCTDQLVTTPQFLSFILSQIKPPSIGQTLSFRFPGEFSHRRFVSPLDKTTEDSSSRFIGEWSIPILFGNLTLENILFFFTALLCERSVIVTGNSPQLVSAIAMTCIPLMRPFSWQGLFLPLLPSRLREILDAPVPHIAGVVGRFEEVENEHVVINVTDNTAVCYGVPLPELPGYSHLYEQLKPFHRKLYHRSTSKGIAAWLPTPKVKNISSIVHNINFRTCEYLEWIFNTFHSFWKISNCTEEFHKFRQLFLTRAKQPNRPFLTLLLDSQLISVVWRRWQKERK